MDPLTLLLIGLAAYAAYATLGKSASTTPTTPATSSIAATSKPGQFSLTPAQAPPTTSPTQSVNPGMISSSGASSGAYNPNLVYQTGNPAPPPASTPPTNSTSGSSAWNAYVASFNAPAVVNNTTPAQAAQQMQQIDAMTGPLNVEAGTAAPAGTVSQQYCGPGCMAYYNAAGQLIGQQGNTPAEWGLTGLFEGR